MLQPFGQPPALSRCVLALLIPLGLGAGPCDSCHPKEAAASSHSVMARSLRRAGAEPEGTFTTSSGVRFTIRSGPAGTWHRMERDGNAFEYPVAYVIGSGSHAAGYLIEVADHLFQSPICYYTSRRSYDLAPGYERIAAPDFTRPVDEECVLCHSGRALHVRGSANRYTQPVFREEAISCERCHGPVEAHLRRPVPGSIINPAKLKPPARDSVCEQCHLAGVTRVLNPGKSFGDFHPGQRLEDVFTVYVRVSSGANGRPFKVISHAEQLAQSACARNSNGRLWCGTCHDPHPASPATAQTYTEACESCHQGRLPRSHLETANCARCHMTRRPVQDGGHTVFTDHRITRRPESDESPPATEEVAAWRDPPLEFASRNVALANLYAGIAARSPAQIVHGYRMLTEVQKTAPDDVAVLKGIGRAL
ncbi:MAG TPA: hypothetical protein VKB88_16080, partial [Bryobacteraceae bacterium]|nr:hypothetical protein [Bryobacteraceae bacterium]